MGIEKLTQPVKDETRNLDLVAREPGASQYNVLYKSREPDEYLDLLQRPPELNEYLVEGKKNAVGTRYSILHEDQI